MNAPTLDTAAAVAAVDRGAHRAEPCAVCGSRRSDRAAWPGDRRRWPAGYYVACVNARACRLRERSNRR